MKHYEKAFYFIVGHGRGWAFSLNDLFHKFTRQEADSILSYLAKKKIRRVAGAYTLILDIVNSSIKDSARILSRSQELLPGSFIG